MTTLISMSAIDRAKGSFQISAVAADRTVLYNRALSSWGDAGKMPFVCSPCMPPPWPMAEGSIPPVADAAEHCAGSWNGSSWAAADAENADAQTTAARNVSSMFILDWDVPYVLQEEMPTLDLQPCVGTMSADAQLQVDVMPADQGDILPWAGHCTPDPSSLVVRAYRSGSPPGSVST